MPVVGMAATTTGSGYYLVASDGGVLSYNAPFLGSTGGKPLNAPMVGISVAGSPHRRLRSCGTPAGAKPCFKVNRSAFSGERANSSGECNDGGIVAVLS